MRRIGLLLVICHSVGSAYAQSQDEQYEKKELNKTTIDAFYSLYSQEGNHSAITGGSGTEKLLIYGAGVNLNTGNNKQDFSFGLNADVISSASTDKIDFVVSSASSLDGHVSSHFGYQRNVSQRFSWGAKYLVGIESDYLSHGGQVAAAFSNKTLTRTFSFQGEVFYDDLRWGRLNPSEDYRPTTLIYPSELRYKRWFSAYTRTSYNGTIAIRQDINISNAMSFETGFTLQEGLLSTPFHRVYFADSHSVKVENLPPIRHKVFVALRHNYFTNHRFIIRSSYRFYWDDFQTNSHTMTLETPFKLSNAVTLYPSLRGHIQSASVYFKPYAKHAASSKYYSSDYDLSGFKSCNLAFGVGFFPNEKKQKTCFLHELIIRYSFYRRTDGLSAHTVTTAFGLQN